MSKKTTDSLIIARNGTKTTEVFIKKSLKLILISHYNEGFSSIHKQ
jgi:hypothetical protein